MMDTAILNRQALTPRQSSALDELVAAFEVEHSRHFEVVLKVYEGKWTEVDVNPNYHEVRKSKNRCRI